MKTLESFQLSEVSGGLIPMPDVDGIVIPTPPYALEVGQTGMGDDLSYTGSSGGYSPAQCATLGSLAGISTGLIVGGTCAAVAVVATGGTAVPACGILGTVSGAAASTATAGYCNTQARR